MPSRSETGHARNVALFEELITLIQGLGSAYQPSRSELQLSNLQPLAQQARAAIAAVNASHPAYSLAVDARETAFAPLSKRLTRVLNALRASGASPQVIESAKTLFRLLQGKRASAPATPPEGEPVPEGDPEIRSVSVSRMSYDSRLDNFDKLIRLLQNIPAYAPNEEELKTESLLQLYNELSGLHAAVVAASVPLNNARLARNEVLYKPETGMVPLALDAKTYIKSVFGATSPQYRRVSGLRFMGY